MCVSVFIIGDNKMFISVSPYSYLGITMSSVDAQNLSLWRNTLDQRHGFPLAA